MTTHLLAGSVLAALIAAAAGSAGAAGNAGAPRCVTDRRGTETCRYPDGTTTQRSTDKLGVTSFRDRDGTVTREKAAPEAVAVEVRGKTVARCRADGQALCRR
jgi:hypothetical protein